MNKDTKHIFCQLWAVGEIFNAVNQTCMWAPHKAVSLHSVDSLLLLLLAKTYAVWCNSPEINPSGRWEYILCCWILLHFADRGVLLLGLLHADDSGVDEITNIRQYNAAPQTAASKTISISLNLNIKTFMKGGFTAGLLSALVIVIWVQSSHRARQI